MIVFLIRRLLRLAAVLAAITVVSFAFVHLIPGRSRPIALGRSRDAGRGRFAAGRSFGLDRPWYVQLGLYFAALLHGDLGRSLVDMQPVAAKLAHYFPATVELTLGALLFAIVVGVPAGVFAALRRASALDTLTMGAVLTRRVDPGVLARLHAGLPAGGAAHRTSGLELFPVSGRISLSYYVPARTHLVVLDALLAGNGRAALDALWHLVFRR